MNERREKSHWMQKKKNLSIRAKTSVCWYISNVKHGPINPIEIDKRHRHWISLQATSLKWPLQNSSWTTITSEITYLKYVAVCIFRSNVSLSHQKAEILNTIINKFVVVEEKLGQFSKRVFNVLFTRLASRKHITSTYNTYNLHPDWKTC